MDDILHASIGQIAAQIRKRELSPVELIDMTIKAIDQCEPQLNAFITVFREESLEGARQAEAEIRSGKDLGPLHGMPIALKDIICVEGTRSTAGSNFFSEESPQFDAALVSKLKAAGAIIIGKTNLHEFAFGVTTENPHLGRRLIRGTPRGCRGVRVGARRQLLLRAAVLVHWAATQAGQSVSRRRYVGM